jgi:Cd2+/Zn2+-exporting ATPase
MTIAELITHLHRQPGVVSARYDEQSRTLKLRYDGTQVSPSRLELLVEENAPSVSLQATPVRLTTPEEEELAALPWMARLTTLCLILLALAWSLEVLAELPAGVAALLYVGAYLSGGFYSVQEAWGALREREFDVNVLMVVAALGAALVGQPREGAVLMFLFSLSNTLETYAMGRTHASIRALLDMTPKEAEVYRAGGLARVPVEEVAVGELVLVRPGAQIPTDGVVARGESAVNEAPITGEALPVEKVPGARVYAGTLNGQGALDVRVATAVEGSTLARIVAVVREARQQKARSQDFTDRVVGRYYAYGVVGIALLALLIPLLFLGWDLKSALYRAMTLMVVASVGGSELS